MSTSGTGQQAYTSNNKKAGYGPSMTTFTEADRRKILESLTADEMATFQEAFTVFDKNQDGTITTKVSLFKKWTKYGLSEQYCLLLLWPFSNIYNLS